MTPFFTLPPLPHFCLRDLASFFNPVESSATPFINVTPFPLRPLVSRINLTIPSLGMTCFFLHTQCCFCLLHPGHIVPDSVEYTSPEGLPVFFLTIFSCLSGSRQLYLHRLYGISGRAGDTTGIARAFTNWIQIFSVYRFKLFIATYAHR